MNVLGIGVDLVDVARLRESIERHGERFLARVFTEGELETCAGRTERLAARFAAKEAVAKAFGTGIGAAAAFVDIEVVNDAAGAPSIVLHGDARRTAATMGVQRVLVSLSHTAQQAMAQVMLLG